MANAEWEIRSGWIVLFILAALLVYVALQPQASSNKNPNSPTF